MKDKPLPFSDGTSNVLHSLSQFCHKCLKNQTKNENKDTLFGRTLPNSHLQEAIYDIQFYTIQASWPSTLHLSQ